MNAIQTQDRLRIDSQNLAYDDDMIPANWDIAEAHGKALRPGKYIPTKNQACPCCRNYIEKEPVGYCENTKELTFLGDGIPLFYNFFRFCIAMLVVLFFDNALIGLLVSIEENDCQETVHRLLSTMQTTCDKSVANNTSYIINVESKTRLAIKITAFVGQLLLLAYFRVQQSKLAAYIDERSCTISDYAMYLSNIPVGQSGNRQKIKKLIEQCQQGLQVCDMQLIESMQKYEEEQKKLKAIVKKLQKAIKGHKPMESAFQRNRYYEQRAAIEALTRQMAVNEKEYFQGSAFVILSTEEQRNKAIKFINHLEDGYVRSQYPSYTGTPRLKAIQADQPRQIIWQNIHYSRPKRYLSIFLGWLVTVIVMGAIFTAFYFLIQFKSHLIEEAEKLLHEEAISKAKYDKGVALGYIIVILINLINKFVLAPLFHKFTHYEKFLSVSYATFSFALKYAMCMFFTTALMTLIVEAAIASNYTGPLGVIEEQYFMFIFNAYFSPVMWFINPYAIAAWIKRKCHAGNQYYTQRQANKLMELPEYLVGKRYGEIIKTMWFTFMYVTLIPFGTVFSLTGLLLYYYVDRYVLTYKSSVKENICSKLSCAMITVLEFTVVLQSIGELVFDRQLRNMFSVSSLVMMCIGLVYMCLPTGIIFAWVNNEKYLLEEKPYIQAKEMLPETYETLYPIKRTPQMTNPAISSHNIGVPLQTGSNIQFVTPNAIPNDWSSQQLRIVSPL